MSCHRLWAALKQAMEQVATTILKQTQSGPIQVVWNGVFAAVQFNCNCLDALHLCHGMCCRNRSGYSVELETDEVVLYQHRAHPTRGIPILAHKEDGSCVYLTEQGRCGTYETRPRMCRQWHCSPAGQINDAEIERRDAGWMLLPVRSEEAEFVQLRMKGV